MRFYCKCLWQWLRNNTTSSEGKWPLTCFINWKWNMRDDISRLKVANIEWAEIDWSWRNEDPAIWEMLRSYWIVVSWSNCLRSTETTSDCCPEETNDSSSGTVGNLLSGIDTFKEVSGAQYLFFLTLVNFLGIYYYWMNKKPSVIIMHLKVGDMTCPS